MMTRRQKHLYAHPIDTGCIVDTHNPGRNSHPNLNTSLTPSKILNKILVLSIFITTSLGQSYAYAASTYSQDRWKLYMHMKVVSDRQYVCISRLWYLESRWNNKSDNNKSTAYGIAQVLDTKSSDPYKQIDAGLRYIKHRYNNDGCQALAHHNKHGYY